MIKNSKSKHTIAIDYAMRQVSDIGHWNLLFIWNLVLVYWCFVIK